MEKIKNNYYFQSFVRLSEYSFKASKYLDDIVARFDPGKLEKYKTEMHEIEHQADIERHQVISNLFKEFITPIEREDILAILSSLDDVTDSIEDVVLRMYMFNVRELRPEMRSFTDLIGKCTASLRVLLEEFCHFKKSTKLKESISEVLKLEEDCDAIYSKAVHEIFTRESDPVKLFIWEDLFLRLEDCCDACGFVSKQIENALFKNL
jgi:hypothetical protein